MNLTFKKYHGLGNDYLVYDCNKNTTVLNERNIRLICDRNFGLGSDGILVGPYFDNGRISVKIFNPDGGEAEKSGNGVRIFSKYLHDAGYVKGDEYILGTLGGDVSVKFLNNNATKMTASMGKLSFSTESIGAIYNKTEMVDIPLVFGNKEYRCTCVSIGNPHCVIPVEMVSKELVCEIGQYSETAVYFPKRINTQIVKIIDRANVQIEIFERGAGYTLASGSSCCAAAGACFRLGLVDNEITVRMPGGELLINITDDFEVSMTGTVCSVGEMILSEEFITENRII